MTTLTWVGAVGFALPLGWMAESTRSVRASLLALLIAATSAPAAAFAAGQCEAAAAAVLGLAVGCAAHFGTDRLIMRKQAAVGRH